MAKSGRKSIEITDEQKQEAREILNLALQDVGGVKSNITYNKVVTFNAHIADNPDYIRSDGSYYKKYGIRFWSRDYNGQPYFGKQIIDDLKKVDITVAGEVFEIENYSDISALVKKYNKKPDELTRRLVKLFSKNDNLIKDLRTQIEQLETKLENTENKLKKQKQSTINLFYNSSSAYNSIEDIFSLNKSHDHKVEQDLLNIFEDKNDIKKSFDTYENQQHTQIQKDNVVNLQGKLNKMGLTSAEDEGF